MTFNLLFLRCSFKYLQTGLSHDEALFDKRLTVAARIICSLKANKFHTCRLEFFATYTPNGSPLGAPPQKRAKLALPPAGGKLCEAFFDKLRAVS